MHSGTGASTFGKGCCWVVKNDAVKESISHRLHACSNSYVIISLSLTVLAQDPVVLTLPMSFCDCPIKIFKANIALYQSVVVTLSARILF